MPLRVCLLDESGAALTGFDYTELSWDAAGEVIIGVRPDGGCDVLGADGAVRWSSDFIWLTANGEGGWLALRALGDADDPARGELVLVGADGGQTPLGARATRWDMRAYHDGLCAVYADGGYRYLDANGEAPFSAGSGLCAGLCLWHGDRLLAVRALRPDRYRWRIRASAGVQRDGARRCGNVAGAAGAGRVRRAVVLFARRQPAARRLCARRRRGVRLYDWLGAGERARRGGTAYFSPQGEMLFRAAEDESVSAWYARTDDTDPQRVVVQTGEWPDTECRLTDMSGAPVGESYPAAELPCVAGRRGVLRDGNV